MLGRRKAACGCCARRGRSWSRSSCSTTPTRCWGGARRPPAGEPDLDVEEGAVRTRAWHVPSGEIAIDTPLLIADGHHRYETAVAFRQEDPSATHTFAILVSARAPGVEIFPTHRMVEEVGDVPGEEVPVPGAGVTLYRGGRYTQVATDD